MRQRQPKVANKPHPCHDFCDCVVVNVVVDDFHNDEFHNHRDDRSYDGSHDTRRSNHDGCPDANDSRNHTGSNDYRGCQCVLRQLRRCTRCR